MKPVNVSIRVNRPREEVYAFLDVLANHASFTDHMLVDWSFDGPVAGVGAKARMRAKGPGQNWMEIEVLTAQPPVSSVEETVGAGGRRRTRGTYTLDELPDGGTDIHFRLEYLEVPRGERLAAPLIHAYMKQANAKAMRRLGHALERPGPQATAEPSRPAA
jgi:hypothetical protein